MAKDYQEQPIKVPRFKESEGFYTTEGRSKLMSKIKGKHTIPEVMFRKALWERGVRFRVDFKGLPGKPDIANKAKKFVVFIDGEFWHGRNWAEKKLKIKSNQGFWIPKIERNMQRDAHNNAKLSAMGFQVFRFWDSEVKKDLDGCVKQVMDYLETFRKTKE